MFIIYFLSLTTWPPVMQLLSVRRKTRRRLITVRRHLSFDSHMIMIYISRVISCTFVVHRALRSRLVVIRILIRIYSLFHLLKDTY